MVHTVNDADVAKGFFASGISAIYTDFLPNFPVTFLKGIRLVLNRIFQSVGSAPMEKSTVYRTSEIQDF
jgi:hypothetical protein